MMEYGLEFGFIMFGIGVVVMTVIIMLILSHPEMMKFLAVVAFAALTLFLLATGNVVFGIVVGAVAIMLLK